MRFPWQKAFDVFDDMRKLHGEQIENFHPKKLEGKMIEIKAPNYSNRYNLPPEPFTVFLAGSIEMGTAENWQQKIVEELRFYPIIILNPRRDDWDSSWVQSIKNPKFKEQVMWEIHGQLSSHLILMYFSPNTKSPITLLELGLSANRSELMVCCPEGFWRKGNVEVICDYFSIPLYENFEEFVKAVKNILSNKFLGEKIKSGGANET
jgi:hypothetical protein